MKERKYVVTRHSTSRHPVLATSEDEAIAHAKALSSWTVNETEFTVERDQDLPAPWSRLSSEQPKADRCYQRSIGQHFKAVVKSSMYGQYNEAWHYKVYMFREGTLVTIHERNHYGTARQAADAAEVWLASLRADLSVLP